MSTHITARTLIETIWPTSYISVLEGELSIKNVALQSGYSNFSYFSKVFRELTGVTPAEYREKLLR